MKIYVCVKHVPDTAATIKVVGEADFDRTVKFVMNPYDEYAMEEAVRQKQAARWWPSQQVGPKRLTRYAALLPWRGPGDTG